MRKAILAIFSIAVCFSAYSADPTSTNYTPTQCQGTAMPYPVTGSATNLFPDSLTPVFINHIGRHGARFLSSSKYTTTLSRYLHQADSLKTITPTGRNLLKLCEKVVSITSGRWGALDSLGMAEQRGIASRMFSLAPQLFNDTKINAISSYVPRCIASMNEFTHQLSRLDNHVEIYTASGRQNSTLLRPWKDDRDYEDFITDTKWQDIYNEYSNAKIPESVAIKALGTNFPFTKGEAQDIALNIYKLISGCTAFSLQVDASNYMTEEEYNALWSVENLHHYLTYSASTVSQAPMDMASALLNDIIETTDQAAKGNNEYTVMLRFGHAETMMPLLALIRMQGCYYMTNYFDTVGLHWRDFFVAPMASNLQLYLLKSNTGKLYVRVDLNETPTPFIPGRETIYIPWQTAKDYLIRCLPLHLQP